jgi:predicted chitinase
MLLKDQLVAIMPTIPKNKLDIYYAELSKAMVDAGIDTVVRAAAFLAQLAHESGELKYFEEIADGSAYEGRKDLGNTQPGDGRRYKGRSPIQLTGRSNYKKAGEALKVDLETNPLLAATPEYGFKIAAWYWTSKGLNAVADGLDLDKVTKIVNGGYNGKIHRDRYYLKALQVLGKSAKI